MKTMGVQTEVAGTVVSRGRGILVKSRQGAAIPGTGIACDQGRCIFGNNRCVWLTNVPQNAV